LEEIMVRIRSGWIAALAVASFAVGCKKDDSNSNKDKPADKTENKTADKTPDKQPDKTAEKTPDPKPPEPGNSPPMMMQGNADDLSLLPVDSEVVMGLNFAQLQTSALWKQFAPLVMSKAAPALAKFKDACGFDPMTAIKSVSLGMKNLAGGSPDGVVVIHGVEKSKAMGGCLDKAKEAAAKDGTTITVDGDIISVKGKTDNAAFMFVNDNTLVGTLGASGTKAGVKAAAAGGSALKTSAAFVDMYNKINTQDSMWMLANGNSKLFDKAGSLGVKPKAVFGSLNVTDGLTVDIHMRLDSPDQATQLANMGKAQAAGAKVYFDKIDITNDGADVRIALGMSNAKLQQLISQFGGMLGSMGGMGGP
jgi:hypothetical protein